MSDFKKTWKKIWRFIWYEDSVWSWMVNIILAFVLIKFLVYPGLGLILGTGFPIVAVVSSSMEHDVGFDQWWDEHGSWYDQVDLSKEEFSEFSFRRGFNKGDIMILIGKKPDKIKAGEVIVFKNSKPDPIIHRVVNIYQQDGKHFFHTKGDNNPESIKSFYVDETKIPEENVLGVAKVRVPLLGYIKIWFVQLIGLFVG